MTIPQRLMVMIAIMATQSLVIGLMIIRPENWIVFMIIWWALAGIFWWQFIEASRS